MFSVSSRPPLSERVSEFLLWCEVDLRFSKETIIKYGDCLSHIERWAGKPIDETYSKADVLDLKRRMHERGLSTARQISILLALKRFLRYLADEYGMGALNPVSILVPRRERKEVGYLTNEEVRRFVESIRSRTSSGQWFLPGLRFRALVEVLLGSAMRISEVLSLNRDDVDFRNREAKVVGKGRKERTVFFTDRALYWIAEYLKTRTDAHPALFVTKDFRQRLKRTDVWRPFVRHRKLAGINKKLTPHLLRHTAATQLLFNGCPIGHIKEILGHERLETTCRYYLGLDHRAAKAAHQKFLTYASQEAWPRAWYGSPRRL